MAIKKKPEKKQKLFAKKSRFNTFQAFTVVLVVVVGGLLTLQFSHAASNAPTTYYYNTKGIKHNTGSFKTAEAEKINGKTVNNVKIWRWPNPNKVGDSYQTSHYMQYGPYARIHIPKPYDGLHVCYYYSVWSENGSRDVSAKILVDLRFSGSKGHDNVWTPDIPSPEQPQTVRADPLLYGYLPTMRAHCYNHNIVMFEGRDIWDVEFRLKVLGSSPNAGIKVDLWKTTVQYWNDPSF